MVEHTNHELVARPTALVGGTTPAGWLLVVAALDLLEDSGCVDHEFSDLGLYKTLRLVYIVAG